MKKVLFGLAVSVLCLGILGAEEGEEGNSMFSPSISVENELTVTYETQGEDATKGNVKGESIENSSTAKFGVGISVADNFSLKPYIQDSVDFNGSMFESNTLGFGLGMKFSVNEAFNLSAKMGYINKVKKGEGTGTDIKNGFKFGVGAAANVESVFLELEAGYEVKGMFEKTRMGTSSNEYILASEWKNALTLEGTMDFLNFVKDGLNSGLIFSNELEIKIGNKTTPKDKELYDATRTIKDTFAVGMHFAPVEFLDARFAVQVEVSTDAGWDGKKNGGKYKKGEGSKGSTAVGLPIGLAFSKGMFSLGIEYTPTLSSSERTYAADGGYETEKGKGIPQELKVTVGIEL